MISEQDSHIRTFIKQQQICIIENDSFSELAA